MLCIIAVDPLLAALQRIPRVKCVSGFVDDWSAGCRGFGALAEVSTIVTDFERASGQRINRGKSAVIPARVLSGFEQSILYAAWGAELRISYRERVLGVYIGIHARIEDQYSDAMAKFEKILSIFQGVRKSLSLTMRILVANVFLYTLFSFPNRQFFMPNKQLREVEHKTLAFLTPISWTKLGMFTAVGQIYGVKISLRDLRISNVASVLSTCDRWRHVQQENARALAR